MGEFQIANVRIVFQDPFHFKNLYKFVYFWLIDNEYLNAPEYNTKREEDLEVFYSEQVRLGDVKEYHVWWRTEKTPHNRPYFRRRINVDFLGLGIRNTEVVRGDKKYKMQIGEITIQIQGVLITEADKPEAWEKNIILRTWRTWFEKFFFRAKVEEEEDFVYEDVYKLHAAIKEYLELRQFVPAPDVFFEKKGFE